MVVICNECGSGYNIDVGKILGAKARCKCKSCGYLIEVVKPVLQDPFDQNAAFPLSSPNDARGKVGLSIGLSLLINFLGFAVLLGFILTFVYMKYVPALLEEQVDLRTVSIAKSLSTAVSQPLLLRNYLRINKTAEEISQLPGVAYVSVLNKKGIVVAGIFGDLKQFSPAFSARVEEMGFPEEVASQNPIRQGTTNSSKKFIVGGMKIYDVAEPIRAAGGVVHVGLFMKHVENAVNRSLKPLLLILAAFVVIGGVSLWLLARTISNPIKSLTSAAQRLSLGELDLPISINKGGEIGELAASLERMRISFKAAMDRLRRR